MRNLAFKIIFVFLIVAQIQVFGQSIGAIGQKFSGQQKYFTEKIYVHTDKSQYFVGELLWFKLYNIANLTNSLSRLSKVAYVEIIDERNQPKAQTMIALQEGMGSGSIELSNGLETGTYTFRAYTNLMKNAGVDVFFEKKITIINPSGLKLANEKKPSYDIDFFPEGGDLIEGIPAYVAFKAFDNNGIGITIKGAIIDDKNDTVSTFNTLKYGIGKFLLSTKPGRRYKAICVTSNKEIFIKELTFFKKTGYALQLKDLISTLEVSIASNLNEDNIFIAVHNGKRILDAQSSSLIEGRTKITIDKDKLSAGIHHLTVFNHQGKPVAERLFFKKGLDRITFNTKLSKFSYLPREKVTLDAFVSNTKDNLKSVNASFAIYKIDSLQQIDDTDIVSYLQLTSELKGSIENPFYYFSNDSDETLNALDNLLLTQGWRRFNWEKQDAAATLRFLPEYNDHLVSGKVLATNNTPIKNLAIYLSSPKKQGAFYHSLTDSVGEFLFNTNKLYGYNELIIQADYTKDSTSQVTIFSPYFEQYRKSNYQTFNNNKKKQLLEDYYFSTQVENIYSKEFFNKYYIPDVSANFYGKPSKSYQLSDYTRFNTLEEVVREYVSEIYVSKRQKSFNFRLVGGAELLENNPLVLYDGVPYFDINKMMAVSPDDIEKIELVKDKYYYSGETYDGIVNFYSKKATLSDYELNPKAIVIDYEGMQLQREFYAPKYDTVAKNRLPDYRNMLHWEPNLLFNGKDKTAISFYTSDIAGKYIGVIQGVAIDGTPGFNTFEIEVKK